jgi:mannose-6-phosphate isomerase-like protein (cupin superfamily)
MAAKMRRIVTGHDADGKAIVVEDGQPPVVFTRDEVPGLAFYEVWNTQSSPAKISAKSDPTKDRPVKVPPPKGGTIIRVIDFPPEDPNKPKPPMALAGKLFELMGLHPVTDPKLYERHQFMHRTQSVDYGIVLEGAVTLLLDDTEVDLKAGDVVVQNGTIHAWKNTSGANCRMAFILVDGEYEPGVKPVSG